MLWRSTYVNHMKRTAASFIASNINQTFFQDFAKRANREITQHVTTIDSVSHRTKEKRREKKRSHRTSSSPSVSQKCGAPVAVGRLLLHRRVQTAPSTRRHGESAPSRCRFQETDGSAKTGRRGKQKKKNPAFSCVLQKERFAVLPNGARCVRLFALPRYNIL